MARAFEGAEAMRLRIGSREENTIKQGIPESFRFNRKDSGTPVAKSKRHQSRCGEGAALAVGARHQEATSQNLSGLCLHLGHHIADHHGGEDQHQSRPHLVARKYLVPDSGDEPDREDDGVGQQCNLLMPRA
jgi:hypothetical protein